MSTTSRSSWQGLMPIPLVQSWRESSESCLQTQTMQCYTSHAGVGPCRAIAIEPYAHTDCDNEMFQLSLEDIASPSPPPFRNRSVKEARERGWWGGAALGRAGPSVPHAEIHSMWRKWTSEPNLDRDGIQRHDKLMVSGRWIQTDRMRDDVSVN